MTCSKFTYLHKPQRMYNSTPHKMLNTSQFWVHRLHGGHKTSNQETEMLGIFSSTSSDNLHGCLSPSGQARNTPQVVCLSAKLSVASRAKPDYSQNLLYADSFPDLPTRVQYSPSIAILQLSAWWTPPITQLFHSNFLQLRSVQNRTKWEVGIFSSIAIVSWSLCVSNNHVHCIQEICYN